MSGIKRSEVQTVLANADKSRKEIFDKKFKNLNIAKKIFENTKIETHISSISIENEKIGIENTRKEILDLDNNVRKLQKTIEKKAKTFSSYAVENFDDEYTKAGELLNSYKQKGKQLSNLEKDINQKRDELLKSEELKQQAIKKQTFIDDKISNITYSNPLDYEEQMSFVELCEEFMDTMKKYDEIVMLQSVISKEISDENYINAMKNIDILNEKVADIEEAIEKSIIKTKENLQTAWAIEEVLEENGYVYESELIDGKLSNGIKIKTINNNDFELNLTNIVVHDEEKIDVDFTINDNNTGCKIKATELQEKLYKKGIPFDITNWGTAECKKTGETQVDTKKDEVRLKI